MRAVVVRPPVPGVAVEEVPAPVLGPGAIRVAVRECGVCGTDHDVADGKYGRAPEGDAYLILGHENLGEVIEVAPEASGFRAGDLVVATVRRGCGICRFCLSGRSDFCETGRFTERGISGAHGYMADEYVEIPPYLVRVDSALTPVAVLLEPLSVVEKAIAQGQAVLDRKEPTPGHSRSAAPRALVAGTGAIGMLAAFALRARGYDVVAVDRHGEDTPAAVLLRRIGAQHTNVSEGLGAVRDSAFDLVIEATGSVALDLHLAEMLGPNGVLVLTGIPDPAATPISVAAGPLFREVVLGNRAIVGSVNANRADFESGLEDLARFESRWPGACASIISARRPLEEVASVLAEHVGGAMKTVLTVRRGSTQGRSGR